MNRHETAFDLFQLATCQIAAGERRNAETSLSKAIRKIDANGIDAYIRPDLVSLRNSLMVQAQA